jgi:biopolymer transport protein ExbD
MRPDVRWLVSLVLVVGCQRADEQRAAAPAARRDAGAAAAVAATPPPSASATAQQRCPPLVVALRPGGVWIGDEKTQGVAAPCGGEIDRAAVKERLCGLAGSLPAGCDAIQIAADAGVRYQQVVDLMDLARSVGLSRIGLTDPGSLAVPLREPPAPSDTLAARCGAPVPECPPRPGTGGAAGAGAAGVEDAVVMAVPADGSVLVGGEVVASAAEASAGERIEPLFQALRARSLAGGWQERTAILQADRAVDARVVNRVIATAHAAGYRNLLFAVKPAPAAP